MEIITDDGDVKDNVIKTLEKAGIIQGDKLSNEVSYKLQLKWKKKAWNTKTVTIENRKIAEETFANIDESLLKQKLNLNLTSGINRALPSKISNYNDVVESINIDLNDKDKVVVERAIQKK